MKKVLTIVGARPQIIKAAALSRAITNKYENQLSEIIVHTGQHYDNNMSEVFFNELNIPQPMYNLGIGSGSHGRQTALMIEKLEQLFIEEKPDYCVVYGDTNSTLACAVAASKLYLPLVHIEAGLRSFNKKMPEEINRITCDHLSTMLFSPTKTGYDNLIKEGFNPNSLTPFTPDNPGIFHCGDVMYDNFIYFSKIAEMNSKILENNKLENNGYILVTIHRDFNTDSSTRLTNIFESLIRIIEETKLKIVLPLHPRTKKMMNSLLKNNLLNKIYSMKNIIISCPASFLDMIKLEMNSSFIMTDSGGVQKEAYFSNKPCLIFRSETEWVETLGTGKNILVGADKNAIYEAYNALLNIDNSAFPKVFGDGNAANFIAESIYKN